MFTDLLNESLLTLTHIRTKIAFKFRQTLENEAFVWQNHLIQIE